MKSTTKKNNAQPNIEFSSEEIIAFGQKAYEEATDATWKQAEVGRILTQNGFTNAKSVQKLALVEDNSGKHEGKTIISKRGRKRFRYHLYQGALVLVAQNAKFREVYDYYRTREDNLLRICRHL